MGLIAEIKASGISNLTDARYFASYGVSWLGFCFDAQSPDYVSPDTVKEMIPWIYGPELIGEFDRQDEENILNMASFLSLKHIQVPLAMGPFFEGKGFEVWHHARIDEQNTESVSDELLYACRDEAYRLTISTDKSWGELQKSGPLMHLLQELDSLPAGIFLQAAWQAKDIAGVLNTLPAIGLNIRGSAEQKTGIKLFDELDAIMQQLEAEV